MRAAPPILAVLAAVPLGGCSLLYAGDFTEGALKIDAGAPDAGSRDGGAPDAPDATPDGGPDAGLVGASLAWWSTLESDGALTVTTTASAATGPTDAIFVGGTFAGTLRGMPALAPTASLTSRGGLTDGFLVRYSPDGVPQATVLVGGPDGPSRGDLSDAVVRADVDPSGRVYAGVRFTTGLDAPGPAFTGGDATANFAVVGLDAMLAPAWRTTFVGDGADHVADLDERTTTGPPTLAMAARTTSSSIAVAWGGGGDTLVRPAGTLRNWLVARLDATSGAVLWTRLWGEEGFDDEVGGVAIGPGVVAAAGCFDGATTIDVAGVSTSVGPGAVVLGLALDSGSVVWARTYPATTLRACFDDVVLVPAGTGGTPPAVFVALGRFAETVTDGVAATHASRGGLDAMVVGLDPATGDQHWFLQYGAEADEATYHASASSGGSDRRTIALAAYLHPSADGAAASWGADPITLSTAPENTVDGAVVRLGIDGAHRWTVPLVGVDVESFGDVAVLWEGGVAAAGNVRAQPASFAGATVPAHSSFVVRFGDNR